MMTGLGRVVVMFDMVNAVKKKMKTEHGSHFQWMHTWKFPIDTVPGMTIILPCPCSRKINPSLE